MHQKSILLTLLFFCLFQTPAVHGETLMIPGTGACETLLKQLARSFSSDHPGMDVQVPPSTGSGGGIQSVLAGEAVLARVARPLKETENGLVYLPFAKDSVVFATGAGIRVNSLKENQLLDIFAGRIENWNGIGEKAGRIRVLIREPGDSSLAIIERLLPTFSTLTFSPRSKILYHEWEMVNMLKKYRYSVGWVSGSSLLHTGEAIRPVAIDGIQPTPRNILSGDYRLVGEYAFVYPPEDISVLATAFIRYVFSDKGRQAITALGVVPLQDNR